MIFGIVTEKTSKVLKKKKVKESKDKDAGGYWRNEVDSYIGADKIEIPHKSLKEKDICTACGKGKLYSLEPTTVVRVTGNAPLSAKVYKMARLRCNLCSQVFT